MNDEKPDDDAFTAATCNHRVVCLFETNYCTLCNRILSPIDANEAAARLQRRPLHGHHQTDDD